MAVPNDDELRGLLDRFVCVRLVQMWGVDLRRFAFDGALTWAAFYMNADETIYGRYGSRSGLRERSENEISLPGFKASLRGALALHERYVADPEAVAPQLAGKVSPAPPVWERAEDMPSIGPRFAQRFLGDRRSAQGNCIHCHMVPQNELRSLRATGKSIPDKLLFPYPMPDQVGFRMDPAAMATVDGVVPGSAAESAGLRAGDVIESVQGQAILSTADIQWVLHNAGDPATLEIDVVRGEERARLSLQLAAGWRTQLADWRFVNKVLLREIVGFNVDPLPQRGVKRLKLQGKLALRIDRTTAALRKATGLGNRDLIISVDGLRDAMTVGQLTGYLLRKKAPGSELELTILRISDRFGRQESQVSVPVR